MSVIDPYVQDIDKTFKQLLAEYSGAHQRETPSCNESNHQHNTTLRIDPEEEKQTVERFITQGCGCKNNCHQFFTVDDLLNVRTAVRSYSWDEKNYYLLGQLSSFLRYSDFSVSGRTQKKRKQQTFEYRINIDRPVCRDAFLFYY